MQQILAFLLGTLVPRVSAQIDPCPLNILPCDNGTGDVVILGILTGGAKIAFGSVLFAMMVYYGIKLIVGADNDSTITESYHAYAYALIGTVLAGAAFTLADSFAVQGVLVDSAPASVVFGGVILAFRSILYVALVFNIFYQGFRLVSSQDESQTDKAKKQFIYGLVGAAIVLLAQPLVAGFWLINPDVAGAQAVGIANFMGAILGALAVIAMFVAGLYLVFAVNPQNAEKAKKVLIGAIIILIICILSLALINVTANAPFF